MDPGTPLIETSDGLVLRLHVQPKARRVQIGGLYDGRLRISVVEPADRGRANAAVIRQIAELLQLSRRQVVLLRGETSRQKDLLLEGRTIADIASILNAYLD